MRKRIGWKQAALVGIGCCVVCIGALFVSSGIRRAVSAADLPAPEPATSSSSPSAAEHPLDPALQVARDGIHRIEQEIRDYTAVLVKRERIGDELGDYQFLQVKIRHPRIEDGRTSEPFSVYLKFLSPPSVAGREVIWVEGANDGKLIAHETGFKNFIRAKLDPNGFLAMMGNRYPINQIGIRNLVEQLLIKGERDRKHGECEVQFFQNAKVDGRACTLIQVVHPQKRPYFEFHRAQIFIDQELKIPVRYAAWIWPEKPQDQPQLEEEYTYRNVQLNVGLTDKDFDPDNPDYNFP